MILQEFSWIMQIAGVILITLSLHFVIIRLMRKWTLSFSHALHHPLEGLLWFVAITICIRIARSHLSNPAWLNWIEIFQSVGIIFIISWGLLRLITRFQRSLIHKKRVNGVIPIDNTTAAVIARLLRIVVFIASFLVVLQSLGYQISGLLAIGGAGTIIAGLAAKDLLANFFGGLMIYLDRPFLEGDWVRSPDREIEGYVEHIGWRLTRILTFERRPIYIPNSIFATIIVENPSRMSHQRLLEHFGFSYEDVSKVPVILRDIRHLLATHKLLDTNEAFFVHVIHFGDNALECKLQAFTLETTLTKYLEIQEEIILKIMDIIQHHGAALSSPSMTVHIPNGVSMRS